MSWSQHADWWRSEVSSDHTYESVVTPLLMEMLAPESGLFYLDIGCGEGRVMRSLGFLGVRAQGIDSTFELVRGISGVVVAEATELPFRAGVFDGAYCVLTLEHIENHVAFFTEAARVTEPRGVLALVINHPIWTAPDSTPITDDDGEVLWRPGEYFSTGTTGVPAGDASVVFYHRSTADLLNEAADAGWRLERMVEQPHHELDDQAGIPRLLGCRWRLG